MDKKLEHILYNIDPVFFEEAIACVEGNMNEMNTCMYWGCDCGDGWFKPIATLARKTKFLNELGKQYNVKFVCKQLKEKFGEIRIYSGAYQLDENEEFKPGYEILDKMFQDALDSCEDECSKVCELCGASGGHNNENIVQTSGWISYICKKCARKITENETKQYDENHKDNNFYGIDRITLFRNENAFMNLYHNYSFKYNGNSYGSILHAYFSIVDYDKKEIYDCINITKHHRNSMIIEAIAKKGGYTISDYDLLKDIILAKFSKKWDWTGNLRQDLILTKNKMLINMNCNHDNTLGYCYCEKCKDIEKQNILGKILMEVRTEIRKNICETFLTLDEAKDFRHELKEDLNIFRMTHKQIGTLVKYCVTNKSNIENEEYNFELLN